MMLPAFLSFISASTSFDRVKNAVEIHINDASPIIIACIQSARPVFIIPALFIKTSILPYVSSYFSDDFLTSLFLRNVPLEIAALPAQIPMISF